MHTHYEQIRNSILAGPAAIHILKKPKNVRSNVSTSAAKCCWKPRSRGLQVWPLPRTPVIKRNHLGYDWESLRELWNSTPICSPTLTANRLTQVTQAESTSTRLTRSRWLMGGINRGFQGTQVPLWSSNDPNTRATSTHDSQQCRHKRAQPPGLVHGRNLQRQRIRQSRDYVGNTPHLCQYFIIRHLCRTTWIAADVCCYAESSRESFNSETRATTQNKLQ